MNNYGLLCVIYLTFGAFFYGYDSGLTTSVIGYPRFITYFGFDATLIGVLGSIYYSGLFLGGLAMLYIPNKIGRLRTIILASTIALAGNAMQAGAQSLAVMLVGRGIGGFAGGLVYAVCPTYAAEIAPPHVRGRIGGLYAINISLAYAITEWMGLGFSYIESDVAWRLFFGLQVVPPIVMLIGAIWMPESPRWLIMKGRHEEALVILRRMHQTSDDDTFFMSEFNQIRAQLQLEVDQKDNLFTILKRPSNRKRLYIAFILCTGQQLTGVIPLQNYQVIVYGSLGISGKLPLVLVGIWGTVGVLSNIPGAWFFDKWGRRRMMFIALGIIIPSSILLCAFWASFENTNNLNKTYGILAVVAMFLFLVGYGVIFNSFVFTYIPEILPTPVRAVLGGTITAWGSAFVICLVQVTPIAIEHISWKYFMIFVICTALYTVIFYFYFPETANKTLEEVEELFGDPVAIHIEDAARQAELDPVSYLKEREKSASVEEIERGSSTP
ncbi:uncharacterized protein Z519_09696 [Cladophialophora bantiana CBS 173.52]|uniref:Major facilitator superfamily (MFS) profile domain-containing protein n=1 Tax=Cladophialophora bantiana (strain ATCC 10958 / CBS 173.52 / CDC B-1940 / NIH 8579) TaxID=1442370 RepID=A0A0D2HFL5_CLAB1|nr:uncharacterized protein Z519_09696 [Cladophialophora bantiana CBS 173.52]KIW89540.1 hypothetical protein Z519_09696 [Cladophialophora bantiana CBS 173.52]